MKESFKVINTAPGLTSIDAHRHAELIAWSVLSALWCRKPSDWSPLVKNARCFMSSVVIHLGVMESLMIDVFQTRC